jgi:ankyrin repeat protein
MTLAHSYLLLLSVGASHPETAPYQAALIAAVHHFTREGKLDHLKAILDRHPELVNSPEQFRQPHKPLSTDGYTPLHWAARDGGEEVAAYLIRRGADVNARADQEWRPLHLAAEQGHLALVKLLVEHGADVGAKTATIPEGVAFPGPPPGAPPERSPAIPGRTALECAGAARRAEVVGYLKSLKR